MNSRLIQDTQLLLEQYIAPQSCIQLHHETSPLPLDEMASLLHTCKIPYVRKAVIMGCYYLLCLAVMRHRDVTEPGDATTARDARSRLILDGDYVLGVYVQFAIAMKEVRLMTHLNNLYKKIQIDLIQGSSAELALAELPARIIDFIRSEKPIPKGGDTDEAA